MFFLGSLSQAARHEEERTNTDDDDDDDAFVSVVGWRSSVLSVLIADMPSSLSIV